MDIYRWQVVQVVGDIFRKFVEQRDPELLVAVGGDPQHVRVLERSDPPDPLQELDRVDGRGLQVDADELAVSCHRDPEVTNGPRVAGTLINSPPGAPVAN